MGDEGMSENKQRQLAGKLYYAFTPENIAARRRCTEAVNGYNNSGDVSRRKRVELWREQVIPTTHVAQPLIPNPSIIDDKSPLPPPATSAQEDEDLFATDPWIEPPIRVDYGTNVHLGENVFINFNCTILDTCAVRIGARTLLASGVSLFSGTHPLDPEVRNGTQGPEGGAEIEIGEDCWIGGNVTVLPGVRIGRGCVVGAGSVVTKSVSDYTVVAGNPARKIKDVPRRTNEEETSGAKEALERDKASGKGF